MNPRKQYEKAAERILRRRAQGLNNDSEPSLPQVVLDAVVTDKIEDVVTDKIEDIVPDKIEDVVPDKIEDIVPDKIEEIDPRYEEMTIKQLRKLCYARNPKVEYKKKDTKPELIAKLKDIS